MAEMRGLGQLAKRWRIDAGALPYVQRQVS